MNLKNGVFNMKKHWYNKLNKFYPGLIFGILFPFMGFFLSFLIMGGESFSSFWEIFIKDANVYDAEVQDFYKETRQNILMFCLMTNLLLFYFSFFLFKIDRFSKGLVFITLVLAAISMLFIY
tara:strand:- start:242 stop:607 length:366 start_codon:yes stop_codon:yes gene_type:complete